MTGISNSSLTIDGIHHNHKLRQDGDTFPVLASSQTEISCTVRRWFPLPNITWYIVETDGNVSQEIALTTRSHVFDNDKIISYVTFTPDSTIHTRSLICTASSDVPRRHQLRSSSVTLHVYSKF